MACQERQNPQPCGLVRYPDDAFGMDTSADRPCMPNSRTISTTLHACGPINIPSRGKSTSNFRCQTKQDNEQDDIEGIVQLRRRRQRNLDWGLQRQRTWQATRSPTRVQERYTPRYGDLYLWQVQRLRQGGSVDRQPNPTNLHADQQSREDVHAKKCDPAKRQEGQHCGQSHLGYQDISLQLQWAEKEGRDKQDLD